MKKDLTGLRFSRWVVLCEEGRTKSGKVLYRCRCDCGKEGLVQSSNLIGGRGDKIDTLKAQYLIH